MMMMMRMMHRLVCALLPILGCSLVHGATTVTTSSSSSNTRSLVEDGCDKTGCSHWDYDAAKQTQLEAWQASMTSSDYNWEWILVRVNGVGGLEDADMMNAADAFVKITAVVSEEDLAANYPEVEFYSSEKMNEFVFPPQDNTNTPVWYQIGMVFYLEGTAQQLQVQLLDDEVVGFDDQILVDQTLDIEETFASSGGGWDTPTDLALESGDYTLNVTLWRSKTPIQTTASQDAMGLTEETLTLANDNLAILNYKTSGDSNKKAVLYLAGKSDSFAHPNVLDMYKNRGYDFFTLDPRYCGRTVQYMNNSQYAHWSNDFDNYKEELDLTLQFIAQQNNYDTLVLHCHSTGCLIGLNYIQQLLEASVEIPFDGYVMNAPFLDWGFVGGWFYEFALENTDFMGVFTGDNSLDAEGLSLWGTRNWILYRFSASQVRTLIQSHVNNEWAKAVTTAQEKITSRSEDDPITTKPVFTIVSRGDDTLSPRETQQRLKHVSSNVVAVWLDHNAHDVTMSYTSSLNDDALAEITSWLDWFETDYSVNQSAVYDGSNNTVESSATMTRWRATVLSSASWVVMVVSSLFLIFG